MVKPLGKVSKVYPVRGPLQQFRFESSTAFHCFRCSQNKTSKLITIYGGDWNKMLCNGCYGRVLSLFAIKSGTGPDDERAEQLAELLLSFVPVDDARLEAARTALQASASGTLTSLATRFLATADVVANSLAPYPQLDWSGAVIGLCKAYEVEFVHRVMEPLRESLAGEDLTVDLNDKELQRIARYCAGRADQPPELGSITYFVGTAVNSTSRAASSPLIRSFRTLVAKWPHSGWLISPEGVVKATREITTRFRNPAAHIEELSRDSYMTCREALIGTDGALWSLVIATQAWKRGKVHV